MKTLAKTTIMLAGGALVAAILVGCGGGSSGPAAPLPPATFEAPQTATVTVTAPAPKKTTTAKKTTASPKKTTAPAPKKTTPPKTNNPVVNTPPAGFSIVGAWQVNKGSWGQATPGAIVVFTSDNQCNLYSPRDTYIYAGGKVTGTGLLGGNYTFVVNYKDDNNIDLIGGNTTVSLTRG